MDDLELSLRRFGLAGDVATTRDSVVDHAQRFADGVAAHMCRLRALRSWSVEEVLRC